jgi:hypothetical protein
MGDLAACLRLRAAFLALLDRPQPDWHAIWMLFCGDEWAQRKVRSVASHTLFIGKAPEQWRDDIVDEMLLLLAADFEHTPSLHFERWYGRVLYWLACEVLRTSSASSSTR